MKSVRNTVRVKIALAVSGNILKEVDLFLQCRLMVGDEINIERFFGDFVGKENVSLDYKKIESTPNSIQFSIDEKGVFQEVLLNTYYLTEHDKYCHLNKICEHDYIKGDWISYDQNEDDLYEFKCSKCNDEIVFYDESYFSDFINENKKTDIILDTCEGFYSYDKDQKELCAGCGKTKDNHNIASGLSLKKIRENKEKLAKKTR